MTGVEQLSGMCLEASKAAKAGRLRAAGGFHGSCRGRWHSRPGAPVRVCSCPCHAARETKKGDVEELIAAEKLARLAKAGAPPVRPSRRTKKLCRHGHKMTKLNTGKRGECLRCKRATAKRSRERKRAQTEAGTLRLTERGKNVLACALCLPPLFILCAVVFYGVFLN